MASSKTAIVVIGAAAAAAALVYFARGQRAQDGASSAAGDQPGGAFGDQLAYLLPGGYDGATAPFDMTGADGATIFGGADPMLAPSGTSDGDPRHEQRDFTRSTSTTGGAGAGVDTSGGGDDGGDGGFVGRVVGGYRDGLSPEALGGTAAFLSLVGGAQLARRALGRSELPDERVRRSSRGPLTTAEPTPDAPRAGRAATASSGSRTLATDAPGDFKRGAFDVADARSDFRAEQRTFDRSRPLLADDAAGVGFGDSSRGAANRARASAAVKRPAVVGGIAGALLAIGDFRLAQREGVSAGEYVRGLVPTSAPAFEAAALDTVDPLRNVLGAVNAASGLVGGPRLVDTSPTADPFAGMVVRSSSDGPALTQTTVSIRPDVTGGGRFAPPSSAPVVLAPTSAPAAKPASKPASSPAPAPAPTPSPVSAAQERRQTRRGETA